MPKTFRIYKGSSYVGEYTCRESAGSELAIEFHANDLHEAYRRIAENQQTSITIHMSGMPRIAQALEGLLKEALHTEFSITSDAPQQWSSTVSVTLAGSMRDVYWDMWWTVLIMRLLEVPQTVASVEMLLRNSSSGALDSWYESSDKQQALKLWQLHTMRESIELRDIAFMYACGPVSAYLSDTKRDKYRAIKAVWESTHKPE